MSVKVTFATGPRASVETETRAPAATTTLFPSVGATDARAVIRPVANGPMVFQVIPPSRLCHRFWLPAT
jgi:hypothetical protein